ncbi:nuclear transport factor 2 family protein [Cellulomonas sp. URHB0016]
MSTDALTAFQDDYLATWTEPDADRRRHNIEQLWAPDGRLAVSSLGVTIDGVDAIDAHIGRVHGDLIAGKGLAFSYDQHVESGDALLLRWSMLAPSGDVVARGVDTVFRRADGSVQKVYMFMGVS